MRAIVKGVVVSIGIPDLRVQYNIPGEFGGSHSVYADSKRKNAPAFSIGRDERGKLRGSTAYEVPGPGAYGTADAIGVQQVSSRRSAASTKFGTSQRNYAMPNSNPGPIVRGWIFECH